MTDTAHTRSQQILSRLETSLNTLYSQAERSLFDEIEPIIEELHLEAENATQRQRVQYAEKHGMDKVVAAFVLYSVLANEKGIERINGSLDRVYKVNFEQVARALGVTSGKDVDVQKLLSRYDKRAYRRLVNESKLRRDIAKCVTAMVKRGWSYPKIIKQIRVEFRKSHNSAKLIARTENVRITNQGRFDAGKDAERLGLKTVKIWHHSGAAHPRQDHLGIDGESVPLESEFSIGMMYPGDPAGGPENCCNCGCFMTLEVIN